LKERNAKTKLKTRPTRATQSRNWSATKAFAACIMVVTEPKEWGAQGYVQALGDSRDIPGGQAFYPCSMA